jgi:hypothetical protein
LLDKLFAATSACNIVTTKAKPVNSFIAPTGQGHCYPSQPAFYDIYIPPCAHSWSLVLRNRLLLPYSDAKFGGISADLAIQLSVMSLKFLSVSSTIIHNIHEEWVSVVTSCHQFSLPGSFGEFILEIKVEYIISLQFGTIYIALPRKGWLNKSFEKWHSVGSNSLAEINIDVKLHFFHSLYQNSCFSHFLVWFGTFAETDVIKHLLPT